MGGAVGAVGAAVGAAVGVDDDGVLAKERRGTSDSLAGMPCLAFISMASCSANTRQSSTSQ